MATATRLNIQSTMTEHRQCFTYCNLSIKRVHVQDPGSKAVIGLRGLRSDIEQEISCTYKKHLIYKMLDACHVDNLRKKY